MQTNQLSHPMSCLKGAVFFCVIGLTSTLFSQSPRDPNPPAPCPDCCPTGYSSKATHVYSPNNPKTGQPEPVTVGVRGDVYIKYGSPAEVVDGKTLCFQYKVGEENEWSFSASGGGDSDVCVKDNDPNSWSFLNSTHKYSFSGNAPGTQNCESFKFTPAKPDSSACNTYNLTAIASEGTDSNCVQDNPNCLVGRCNVADSSKQSGTVTIKVWICKLRSESTQGTFTFYFPCEGIGFRNIGYDYTSDYKDCNGEITTMHQEVAYSGGNLDLTPGLNASSTYELSVASTNSGINTLSASACGGTIGPVGTVYLCSDTSNSFDYSQSQQGVVDTLTLSCTLDAPEGNCLPINGTVSAQVTLTGTRCCP